MAVIVRSFFERVAELSPRELFEGALRMTTGGANALKATATNQLTINGVAYTFAGPASAVSVPARLGFEKGDLIVLIGPLGTEPNHGREVVILDPAPTAVTVTVLGNPLVADTPTLYNFKAVKRRA